MHIRNILYCLLHKQILIYHKIKHIHYSSRARRDVLNLGGPYFMNGSSSSPSIEYFSYDTRHIQCFLYTFCMENLWIIYVLLISKQDNVSLMRNQPKTKNMYPIQKHIYVIRKLSMLVDQAKNNNLLKKIYKNCRFVSILDHNFFLTIK